jgi:membrane protein
LLWVYYSAQIFLFGAEITRAYACRFGSQHYRCTTAPDRPEPARS